VIHKNHKLVVRKHKHSPACTTSSHTSTRTHSALIDEAESFSPPYLDVESLRTFLLTCSLSRVPPLLVSLPESHFYVDPNTEQIVQKIRATPTSPPHARAGTRTRTRTHASAHTRAYTHTRTHARPQQQVVSIWSPPNARRSRSDLTLRPFYSAVVTSMFSAYLMLRCVLLGVCVCVRLCFT
jgi:hypothetical protein